MHTATEASSESAQVSAARTSGVDGTRLTAIAGLACFVLIVTAAFVAPPLWEAPGTNASGARVVAYAREGAGRTIASLFIYALAMGIFLCFAAGLWSRLRQIDPVPQSLSAIFAFSAVALVVLILAAFVPGSVLAYRVHDAEVAGALADTTFGMLALSGIPTAVCLGSYAALVLRGGFLPRWTAWLAIVGAFTHIFIAASFLGHGAFLSLEGNIVWVPATFFVWILATSATLLRAGPQADRQARIQVG